jgi:hypothetical protein
MAGSHIPSECCWALKHWAQGVHSGEYPLRPSHLNDRLCSNFQNIEVDCIRGCTYKELLGGILLSRFFCMMKLVERDAKGTLLTQLESRQTEDLIKGRFG